MKKTQIAFKLHKKDKKTYYYGIKNGRPYRVYSGYSANFPYMKEIIDLEGGYIYSEVGQNRSSLTPEELRTGNLLVNNYENPAVLSNDIFKL